jgi:N-glycosylase/DNA lyase
MRITLDPKISPFSLDDTLRCGQVFRWEEHDGWWYGTVTDNAIKIRQERNILEFEGTDADSVVKYFRLNDPLPLIMAKIGKDDYIKNAIHAFKGLRLIRQDPWECLISYICATFSNIPRIKKMINNLAQKFGNNKSFMGYSFYTFPSPESLANADSKTLAACKLGFRAKKVLETAKIIDGETLCLDELEKLNYLSAKKELLKLPGVGDKVADCVLLFSLNKLDAFPVDVWIRKTILKKYGAYFDKAFVHKVLETKSLTHGEYGKVSSFAREYFDKYAGYAQQYLYHYERSACKTV